MEKKFYIPTSSLNFNSIVSSESISPASFYRKRSYGITRFTDIFDGQCPDCILLSEYLGYFNRPQSGMEDHPMVLEVMLDDGELNVLGNGMYQSVKTIHITPFDTRFVFFSEQDRVVAESISGHSIEVKLSSSYVPCMVVVERPSISYDFDKISYNNINIDNQGYVSEDERLNRIKGLLYGYYVGAMLSARPSDIERLRILYDVQDTFSAVISSGLITPKQNDLLEKLSDEWEKRTPSYMELRKICKNDDVFKDILTYFREYSMRPPFRKLEIRAYTQYVTFQTLEGEENPAMRWISEEIEKHKSSMREKSKKISPEGEDIVTDGQHIVRIKCGDKPELLMHWINTLIFDSGLAPISSLDKMSLADNVTKCTKAYIGDDGWQNSEERLFLNKLRRHIGGGEAFDVKWDNGVLSSMAAVILHGSEWDELLDFMQRKGMNDHRLAFALFGAITGYANLTRDFVDMLLKAGDDYAFNVYKEFYGQIFGKEITPRYKKGQQAINAQAISQNVVIEPRDQSRESGFHPVVEDCISRIESAENYKSGKYHNHIQSIREQSLTNWDDIRKLGNNGDGWKSLIDGVRKAGRSINQRTIKNQDNRNMLKLFSEDDKSVDVSHKSIIYDGNAIQLINDCPSLLSVIRPQVVKMFSEFQRSYRSGYYFKNPEKYRRNNSDVIDHFSRWCLSNKNGNALQPTEENRKAIWELSAYLKRKYPE